MATIHVDETVLKIEVQGGNKIVVQQVQTRVIEAGSVLAVHGNVFHNVGMPVAIGAANAEGESSLIPRLDHVHAHPQFASGDLHTEYALADGSRAITGKQDFQAGIRVDTIEELTLDAGVTIDTALIKDGCFQVPSGSFQGLKNSSGLLVLNVSQSSLWNPASSVAAATWGVLWAGGAHMMCQTPDIVGAEGIAPIGGQNFCNAPSVCVGAFYADKAIAAEAYLSWWFEVTERARLNVQGARFEFAVLSAGTLTPVLRIDINGVDVTGNVAVTGTVDGVDISAHAADGAAHHDLVTLGAGSDPALSLSGQELTLADVLTPMEHTAIGDSAPHHAKYTDAEAIAAVEGEATLDLGGAVSVAGLITASAGVKLAAGQAIKDSEAVDRLLLRVASLYQTGDVQQIVGNLRLGVAGWGAMIQGIDGANRLLLSTGGSPHVKVFGDFTLEAVTGLTAFTVTTDSPRLTWDHTGTNPKRLEMVTDFSEFSIFNRTDEYYILRHMLASQVNWIPAPTLIGAAADPAASAVLELQSTTGALLLPRMTTAQRDALTPVNGMAIYNSTLDKFQGYEAGAWANFV